MPLVRSLASVLRSGHGLPTVNVHSDGGHAAGVECVHVLAPERGGWLWHGLPSPPPLAPLPLPPPLVPPPPSARRSARTREETGELTGPGEEQIDELGDGVEVGLLHTCSGWGE